jgi:hypothetical protein
MTLELPVEYVNDTVAPGARTGKGTDGRLVRFQYKYGFES